MKFTVIDPIMPNGLTNMELLEYVKTKCEFKNCCVFRFYSVSMFGTPLNNLVPLPHVMEILRNINVMGDGDSRQFDMEYAHQLLNHSPSFIDLMTLVSTFQFTEETFLLSEFSQNSVVNSLLKFIYERYSINAYMVKDFMDVDELRVSNFDSEEGYSNLINDVDRYKMTYFDADQISREVVEL